MLLCAPFFGGKMNSFSAKDSSLLGNERVLLATSALAGLFSLRPSLEDREPEANLDEGMENVGGAVSPEHGAAGNVFSIFLSILPFEVSGISGNHTHLEGIA